MYNMYNMSFYRHKTRVICLFTFCRLKDKSVFELIHKHDLFSVVSDSVLLLMDFDKNKACTLLTENTQRVPVKFFEKLPYSLL